METKHRTKTAIKDAHSFSTEWALLSMLANCGDISKSHLAFGWSLAIKRYTAVVTVMC